MKTSKKVLSVFLSVALVLSVFFAVPMISDAVSKPQDLESGGLSFWADPENNLTQEDVDAFTTGQSKTTMTGAVGVYQRSTGSEYYYLFLPTDADCTNLKVWFTASSASVDGKELINGEPTDVFSDIDAGGIKQDYTLKLDNNTYNLVAVKSGEVGAIYVNTDSGSIRSINTSSDHSAWEAGSVMVVNKDGKVEYDGIMEKFNGRGNATWSTNNNKNPYALKIGKSQQLMGLGKSKKWVLLANSVDRNSLIKNQIVYDFAEYIGINYQPNCRPVDLYVNQQYYGSYMLAEKVEIKKERVNVADSTETLEAANLIQDETTGEDIAPDDRADFETRVFNADGSRNTNSATGANAYPHTVGTRKYSGFVNGNTFTGLNDPADITGGYVFELEISERWADEDTGFCAYNRQGWVVKSHDYVSKNMADYCYDLLYALGSSVYNGGTVPSGSTTTECSSLSRISEYTQGSRSITNPAPAEQYRGKRWSDILDADSAVRYYWTQEFFKNLDASTSSTYFYKDSDSKDNKLYSGPCWDFDNALGYDQTGSYRWGQSLSSTSGWYAKNTRIYRWRVSDSSTGYTSDSQSPLGFYAALATNCSDFDLMAKSEWYSNIAPAVDVLLGNKTDPKGVLKSTAEYTEAIQKSGTMNNMRHEINNSNPYDAQSVTNSINNWVSGRRSWINEQFGTVDISTCTVDSIPEQKATGAQIKPSLTITNNNSNPAVELKEGKDYTLSFDNNISAGTADVIISGIGYYTGTKTVYFTITQGTLNGATVSISETAKAGDTLSAGITDADSNEINGFVSYQWNANGEAIDGATNSEYTVSESDAGKTITVTVTGNETDITGSATSNECAVATGDEPVVFTETIAAWEYDYTADPTALVNADESGTTYYYVPTSGKSVSGAKLTGSVDTVNSEPLAWSGDKDSYANATLTGATTQVPILQPSTAAWGTYPYFETVVSTKDYQNIAFTASLGGTKKGPRDWKLQYSLDGETFTDIADSGYSITTNKTMEKAFADVQLPEECNDKSAVYIRAVSTSDIIISAAGSYVGTTSGSCAVNNIQVTGERTSAVTEIDPPRIFSNTLLENNTAVYNTDTVSIVDAAGSDIYFSVNNGEYALFNGESFNPFGENAKAGDTVTVSAYSSFAGLTSETVSTTFTYAGEKINEFSYRTYYDKVSGGKVYSNGGAFGSSAKMSAYTDGNNMYVPLWNQSKQAFSIAPDDGARWSEYSGFTFELSTSGYEDVRLSMKAYTTKQGPNSIALQYSLDAENWEYVVDYEKLNMGISQLFDRYLLPAECSNKDKIFIRVITEENLTASGGVLHNNASKGNFYINDITFSGDENGAIKMPYTEKISDFFADGETIKYVSPDNLPMTYTVSDSSGSIVLSDDYSENGISLPSSGTYEVKVKAVSGDASSIENVRSYTFKGETVSAFAFKDKTAFAANYDSATQTVSSNLGVASTLQFFPNAVDKGALSFTGKYGMKYEYDSTVEPAVGTAYAATKNLDRESGNGYYLIKTSTSGYENIVFNASQLSSNSGPRDWGIAYSTDGETYSFVANSNVRNVSNDVYSAPVVTYNDFLLPEGCDNQEELFIKIFINGGEGLEGDELADLLKGNCGINNITFSGTAISEGPSYVDVTINTYLLSDAQSVDESCPVETSITVNGEQVADAQSSITLSLALGESCTAVISANGTFAREIEFTADEEKVINVGVVALDLDGNGIINAKDFAIILHLSDDNQQQAFRNAFAKFINVKSDEFIYQ